ncbi:MAG: outer membrane protein assembly factor [Fervidobacterium sp.]
MNKQRYFFLLFVLSLFFLSISIFGFVLSDVQFNGLKTISIEELRIVYKDYIGKDVNMFAVNDIISAIDETGYFEDVKYELLDGKNENEKVLKLMVTENEPVKKVTLEILGPGVLDKNVLKDELILKEGKAFSFAKFWESIDKIAKIYSDNGYLVATPRSQDRSFAFIYVTGKIEDEPIVFIVKEYVLYDVTYNVITQDEEFKKEFDNIRTGLSIQKYKDYEGKNWFMKIFDAEKNYVPTLQSIQGLLQSLSKYVFVKLVDLSAVELENLTKPAKELVVTVTDNTIISQPVFLKGIKTVGNSLFTQKELIGETREGTYTNFGILSNVQKVKDKYDKYGYFIDLNLNADSEGYLNILVKEIKVGQVKVTGNTLTKDYVFTDLIMVKSGNYLKRSDLQNTYIELTKLNYFKNVDIGIEPVSGDTGQVNVVIELMEKEKKFDFQGGVTWGPVQNRPWYEGIAGLLSLSSTNPTGHGETFSLSLQKALSTTNLSFSGGIRKPLQLPLSINGTLAYQENPTNYGNETKISYSAGVKTLKTELGQFGFELGYKDTTYVASETSLATNVRTLNVSASYIYETLDNLYIPMKGLSVTLSISKYFPINEQGSDALSYTGEFTYHIPVSEMTSLAFRIVAGQTIQTSGESITFKLAGLNQVRGVKSDNSGTVFGLSNNEIRFKAPDQMFYISLFYDMGFVDSQFRLDNIVSSAGVELGLTIPIFGLVRFGWGIPIPSSNLNFYFMFGQTF